MLSLAGLIISGVVVILFVADLAVAFPFQRTSVAADIGFILTGLLVAYLSWSINPRARACPTPGLTPRGVPTPAAAAGLCQRSRLADRKGP